MASLIRIAVLVALTAFMAPSAPTTSAAAPAALQCENSQDCPNGRFCKRRPGHRLGICASPSSAKKKASPPSPASHSY